MEPLASHRARVKKEHGKPTPAQVLAQGHKSELGIATKAEYENKNLDPWLVPQETSDVTESGGEDWRTNELCAVESMSRKEKIEWQNEISTRETKTRSWQPRHANKISRRKIETGR
jgi:hypothetical protein